MLKRPHYIALALIGLLVLAVLNLPERTATQVKLALGSLFLPLFGLAGSAHSLAEHLGNALVPRRVLVSQLDQLRRENGQFRAREKQVEEVWRENQRLSQALGRQKQLPWKLLYAQVVMRDPANWWRTVEIDVGQRQGVTNDSPVLTIDGVLVGKVIQAGATRSRVALVGDPFCGVSALVEGTNEKEAGAISSIASVLDPTLVNLSYMNRPSTIRLGQAVVTSGLGTVFPRGILVGHIIDTNNVGFGLYTEARVKLAADLGNLEEVWVVLR